MFVYVIVNDVNLKIYVGKTTNKNLRQYLQQKCQTRLPNPIIEDSNGFPSTQTS